MKGPFDAENGKKLRNLVEEQGSRGKLSEAKSSSDGDKDVMGYVIKVVCPPASGHPSSEATVVDHVKLFRNHPGIRFQFRIHENVLPSIRDLGGKVAFTDIFVVHQNYDHSPQGQTRKRERDLKLLQLELQDNPYHPFTLFNVGMTFHALAGSDQASGIRSQEKEHYYRKAIGYLRRSIELSLPSDSTVRKCYALMVGCHKNLEEYITALRVCNEGLGLFPDDPELLFLDGILKDQLGDLRGAEESFLRILDLPATQEHFSSLDSGIKGFKTHQNLAVVYQKLGELDKEETQWRQITKEAPEYLPGWLGLAECLLNQSKLREAVDVVAQARERFPDNPDLTLLSAKIDISSGRREEALRKLTEFLAGEPIFYPALSLKAQLLAQSGHFEEAEKDFKELVMANPGDPHAHHNLGTLYLQTSRYEEAVQEYYKAPSISPNYHLAHLQLSQALRALGREEEASFHLKEAELLSGKGIAFKETQFPLKAVA